MPPKKIQHPALLLTQSGDVAPTTITAAGPLTLKAIQTQFKSKEITCVGAYKAKPHMLHLFGLVDEGSSDSQNQHQLPPPYDIATFYGDIILVACKMEDKTYDAPVPFKPEDYEEFYTKMFDGGYESDTAEGAEVEETEEVVDEEGVEEEEAEAKEFAEEEEDEEEELEAEEEVEEEEAPRVKAKAPKKKKPTKAATTLAGVGSAYPDPPILAEEEQLQEETAAVAEIPSMRAKIQTRLGVMLAEHLDETGIVALERCIYNGAIRQAKARHVVRSWSYPLFAHLYTMHALHIISNFHPTSYIGNTDLYEQVKRGDLSFEMLATMNTYELNPSMWREMFEARAVREKKQLEGNRDRATDQFICTRCWKRECTYYEMQTRSADEPMTIFITCLNCGKKWRQ